MYIPVGPSKKQLYKIIIALLLLCYLIFLGMYKPKALTYSQDISYVTTKLIREQTGSLDLFGSSSEAKELIIDINQTLTCNTGYCMISIPYALTYQSNNSMDNANYIIFRDIISYYSITYGAQPNASCSLSNGTIDCLVVNNGTLPKIEIFFTPNSAIGTSNLTYQTSTIIYRVGGWSSVYDVGNNNSSAINGIQNNTNDIKNSINDSSIDNSSANDLTSNSAFQDSNGLDAIIKAPLNFIQSLTSSTCSSISLTIPYIDANVSLPCMSTVYNKALGAQLVNLIALVINGIVLYRYCLKILQLVHNAKNPNKDELEVLDL